MTTNKPRTNFIIDMFGNSLEVTNLQEAIAEREMCVNAKLEFYTPPFTFKDGIEVIIQDRAGERVPMVTYHQDLLTKLYAMRDQKPE